MDTMIPSTSSRSGGDRSGSALVIVLGLLSVLMLMGVAFAVTMRTERMGASNMRHAALARHILDSAMARVMSDLDVALRSYEEDGRFYGTTVPDDIVVLASEDSNADSVIALTHEIARHLPSDQLVAALKTPAAWKPIYGGVSISDMSDANPTSEDPPVGRYAYLVLNGCGTLDPNLVGGLDRENGLSIEEIQLGRSSGEKLLGDPLNGTVSQFLSKRNLDGHYATMRDFLGSDITNIVAQPKVTPSNTAMKFATNNFAIGTMAIEDYAPPSEVDGATISKVMNDPNTSTVYRRPKVSLVDEKGELLDLSKMPTAEAKKKAIEIAEAFEDAFASTYRTDNGTESKRAFRSKFFPGTGGNKSIPASVLAARILLDAMDDDLVPGGSTKHDFFEINKKSSSSFDQYVKMIMGEDIPWDRFPCTEAIPMLDNLVLVGGTDDKEFISEPKPLSYTDQAGNNVTTGMQWKVTIGAAMNSVYYPGWNVPEAARDKFTYGWNFRGIDLFVDKPYEYKSNVDQADEKAFMDALRGMVKKNSGFDAYVEKEFTPWKGNEFSPQRRDELTDMNEVFQFTITLPMNKDGSAPKLPDKFGFTMFAFGCVMQGGDDNILQVAPCMSGSDNVDKVGDSSKIELNVVIDTTKKVQLGDFPVLGATVCVDPMFAYNQYSWISTLGVGEEPDENDPLSKIREYLTKFTAFDDFFPQTSPNPLSQLYLRNPYREFGGKSVYEILRDEADCLVGGISDVMWGNPQKDDDFDITSNKDNVTQAANAFYFDRKSEKAKLNRPGQLGMLPIGTYKTLALLDGFNPNDDNKRVARQRVLDYFTFNPPREEGADGSSDLTTGQPHRGAIHQSKLNINPPRAFRWKSTTEEGTTRTELVPDGYNLRPLTAALMGCPLREWDTGGSAPRVTWEVAEMLAEGYSINLDRDDDEACSEDAVKHWNCEGAAHDVSLLGRSMAPDYEGDDDLSWDVVLRKELQTRCDFDREGILRNSSELFTTRQQLFTVLLKADSFTPKSGFNDASHGTSLASVHAIAHIWRDPEPLRDATGRPIRDRDGNAIHPWVLLDISQF